jgi:ribosomal protein S18 acetylase RimI-like enzyme
LRCQYYQPTDIILIEDTEPVFSFNSHLFSLFVAVEYQGQGAANKMSRHVKSKVVEAGRNSKFTFNSTPYAVPVYECFAVG